MTTPRRKLVLPAVLLLLGAGLLVRDVRIEAKAAAAAVLIDRAWTAHLGGGGRHAPWSWADFAPTARLAVPRLGIDLPVLDAATGEALAFGLGRMPDATASGDVTVAGHRDSWGAFCGELEIGDAIVWTTRRGVALYVVERFDVVDETEVGCLEPDGEPRLTLVTCHPVSGRLPTRERLLTTCRAVESASALLGHERCFRLRSP